MGFEFAVHDTKTYIHYEAFPTNGRVYDVTEHNKTNMALDRGRWIAFVRLWLTAVVCIVNLSECSTRDPFHKFVIDRPQRARRTVHASPITLPR